MIFLHRQNDPEFINFKDVDGIELDVRSLGDRLVLTHDRINNEQISIFADGVLFLEDTIEYLKDYTIIVNVKESGLEEQISELFDDNNIKYYFLDSQIPDIVRLCKQEKFKGKFIIRVSPYEKINNDLLNHSKAEFIWVDWHNFEHFKLDPYIKFLEDINNNDFINTNKIQKILVSPELYGFQNINLTHDIIQDKDITEVLNKYSVCTKIPYEWRKLV